jgi:hypothetical protein
MNELLSFPWLIVIAFMVLVRKHIRATANGK